MSLSMKNHSLFEKYRSVIVSFRDVKDRKDLLLEDSGEERIYYAPFDYVNPEARLFIVGITPGEIQMNNMLVEAARLIHQGLPDDEVLRRCKAVGSFSGPMRKNLVELMDEAGIAEFLDVETTAQLFSNKQELVNLTSCIRYPTFAVKNGKESNFNAEIKQGTELFEFASTLTLEELFRKGRERHAVRESSFAGTPSSLRCKRRKNRLFLGQKKQRNAQQQNKS